MINFENKNLPEAVEENKEKTIKRLEKIKNVTVSIGRKFAGLCIGVGATAGVVFGGPFGVLGGAGLGATISTVAIAVPIIVSDLAHFKIISLRKKMRLSTIQEMGEEQQKKTQNSKDHYNSMLKKYGSNERECEIARNDIAFQEKRDDIFCKATTLAKQDNKEKTIQRLMSLATKADSKISENSKISGRTSVHGIMTVFEGLSSLTLATFALNFSSGANIAVGAIALTTAAATVCCAARTVQSYKEQNAAHKALKVLETYTK